MTPDERADALAAVAVELVGRVRDDEPAAFHRWLRHAMVDAGFTAPDDDSLAMMTVLAAAVPDDRTWTQLTAWVRLRGRVAVAADLAPHGTAAAARRHQYHRESMCEDCKRWDRDRKRTKRQLSSRPVEDGYPQVCTTLSTSELDSDDQQDAA